MLALLLLACTSATPDDDKPVGGPADSGDTDSGETGTPSDAPVLGGSWTRLSGLNAGKVVPIGRAGGVDWLEALAYGDEPRRLLRVDAPGTYTRVELDAAMALRLRVGELVGDTTIHWVTPDEGIYTSEDGAEWTPLTLPWTDGDVFDETGAGTLSTVRQALWHDGALHVLRHVTTYAGWTPVAESSELRVLRSGVWSTTELPATDLALSSDGATLYASSATTLCTLGEAWTCADAALPSGARFHTLGGTRVAVGWDGVAALVDGAWTTVLDAMIADPVELDGAIYFFAGDDTVEAGPLVRLSDDLAVTEMGEPAARCAATGKRLADVGGELLLACPEGAWGMESGRWRSRSPYGRGITAVSASSGGVWVAGDGILHRLEGDWVETTVPDTGWGSEGEVDPATVYVVRATEDDLWIGAGHGRLWKSEGDGFDAVLEGYPTVHVTDVAITDDVFAALWGYTEVNHGDGSTWAIGGGLYRRDGGSWTGVHAGLPEREVPSAEMTGNGPAVVSHVYADATVLLAATQGGIGVSHDAGGTWALPALPTWDAEVERTRTARVGDRLLLAREAPGGLALYASDDDGATWTELAHDLPDTASVGDLITYEGHALLGGADGGVWASDDGVAWAQVATLTVGVHALAEAYGGLLAGTVDGVWRWDP